MQLESPAVAARDRYILSSFSFFMCGMHQHIFAHVHSVGTCTWIYVHVEDKVYAGTHPPPLFHLIL